jgi:hypothetical protein
MQRHPSRPLVWLVLVTSITSLSACKTTKTLTPIAMLRHGNGSVDTGGVYFSTELKKSKVAVASFVEQLDRCLEDIDRLEKSSVPDYRPLSAYTDSLECSKFDQQRSATDAKLKQIDELLNSHSRWAEHPFNEYGSPDPKISECLTLSSDVMTLTVIYSELTWIYKVRTQQSTVQLWRLKGMEESVKQLRTHLSK